MRTQACRLRGGELFGEELHCCPPYDLIRAVPVLVAANVKPRIILIRRAILADVRIAPDLHDRSEPKAGRTCDNVLAAADIRS